MRFHIIKIASTSFVIKEMCLADSPEVFCGLQLWHHWHSLCCVDCERWLGMFGCLSYHGIIPALAVGTGERLKACYGSWSLYRIQFWIILNMNHEFKPPNSLRLLKQKTEVRQLTNLSGKEQNVCMIYRLFNPFKTKSERNFLFIASRVPKQHCFLEGSQASPVCPFDKSNI